MYKIISITDKEGNSKTDFYNELQKTHPNMSGEIYNPELFLDVGYCMVFEWNDDSNKILKTSTIEKCLEDDEKVEVITRNSIYTLEKIK